MARRVLVALDSRDRSLRLLDAATRLAATRRAELVGFYVEETEFLQAAGLPFSKTYHVFGGAWEALDAEAMERAFKAHADELRRVFELLCQRRHLIGRFQTARGIPGECLVEAANEAELVILGRSRRHGRVHTGRTVRRAVAEGRVSVLLFDPDEAVPEKVTALYDGDDGVLAAADEMAQLFQCPIEVVAMPHKDVSAAKIRQKAGHWLLQRGWPARVVEGEGQGGDAFIQALGRHRLGLTVVGSSAKVDLSALLDTLEGPVLIVR